jgi:hypothetical protein
LRSSGRTRTGPSPSPSPTLAPPPPPTPPPPPAPPTSLPLWLLLLVSIGGPRLLATMLVRVPAASSRASGTGAAAAGAVDDIGRASLILMIGRVRGAFAAAAGVSLSMPESVPDHPASRVYTERDGEERGKERSKHTGACAHERDRQTGTHNHEHQDIWPLRKRMGECVLHAYVPIRLSLCLSLSLSRSLCVCEGGCNPRHTSSCA